MIDKKHFSARAKSLSPYAGGFVVRDGILDQAENNMVAMYTVPDMSVRLIISPDDIILVHPIEEKNGSLMEVTVYIKKTAIVSQVTVLSGEIGILSSCSSNGCSKSCPPGQNCSCTGSGANCSCTGCV